ncbi:MAG TPA: hypothetical protein VFR23_24620 [Jiangellaceae bacterium]|nr:hypothetical protein [Jiangellaceae bacterium]
MAVYVVTFAAVAAAAPQDLVELPTPATRRIKILGWEIGQSTEAGDAADEQIRLELIRGHATSGSGGSAFTAIPLDPAESASLLTGIEINNTTLASTGTPLVLHATAFNVRAGHIWIPTPDMRPSVAVSSRVVLRMNSTPADSISFSGSLYFEE